MADAWEEERDESKEPLKRKADNGRQSDPAVQSVQIRDGRAGQIVRIEDGFESNWCQ